MAEQQEVTIDGKCLCGEVKVQASGEPSLRIICHCTECRRSTGTIFSSALFFPQKNFKIIPTRPDLLKTYTSSTSDSGNTKVRTFCGNCGVTICTVNTTSERTKGGVFVPMGILNVDADAGESHPRPGLEFWSKQRTDWFAGVEGAKQFETM